MVRNSKQCVSGWRSVLGIVLCGRESLEELAAFSVVIVRYFLREILFEISNRRF